MLACSQYTHILYYYIFSILYLLCFVSLSLFFRFWTLLLKNFRTLYNIISYILWNINCFIINIFSFLNSFCYIIYIFYFRLQTFIFHKFQDSFYIIISCSCKLACSQHISYLSYISFYFVLYVEKCILSVQMKCSLGPIRLNSHFHIISYIFWIFHWYIIFIFYFILYDDICF